MSALEPVVFRNIIDKDSTAISVEELKGKIVGIYFCPCRGFTPKLAEKYDAILKEGHKFEIIFSSSDEDEDQAMEYFKSSMPWKMISYSDRELDEELSRRFEVRGIPTLVLLDEEGNLITTDGRDALMNTVNFSDLKNFVQIKKDEEERQARELALLKENFHLTTFFQDHLVVDKEGKAIDIEESLRNKVVGLYFSAHWCPPCRGFTPLLSAKYESLLQEGHPLEIIFISSDRDAASAQEYYQTEMPWKMLSYDDRNAKLLLGELFDVNGIPALILIDNDGIITKDGREAIMTTSFDKLKTFEEEKQKQQEILAQKVALMPSEVTISAHEHALKKLESVYRGQYGCDVCHGGGEGWVYHCDECGFDAHPLCACPPTELHAE